MSTGAHQQLAETFVSLVDTLVDDFDLLDFLGLLAEKASDHLEVAAAGVILSDQRGGWHPAATSHEDAELVDLFVVQTHEGPCLHCVHTGEPVFSPDLARDDRWPAFAERAIHAGYRAAAAVPMRSRGQVIGSLTLFDREPGGVDPSSVQLGQAMADVATVGLLQQGASRRDDLLVQQLQAALYHRTVIEQAKGALAEAGNRTPEDAYALLRAYAREQRQHLTEVAYNLLDGTTDASSLVTGNRDTPKG